VAIDQNNNIPLFKAPNEFYRLTLGKVATVDDNRTEWHFTWLHRTPKEGDSVRIDVEQTADVRDLMGNRQRSRENRLVPVEIRTIKRDTAIAAEFSYTLFSTILGKQMVDLSGSIRSIPGVEKMIKEAYSRDGTYEVMVIAAVPTSIDSVTSQDSCWANNLTILDPLGNVVRSDLEMAYDKSTGNLLYLWDGKNSNGRFVGSSSYVARVVINPMFNGRPKGPLLLKGMVGVSKKPQN